jgi:F-box protein 9
VGDDELERFRREWKDEVARKVPAPAAATGTATATATGEKKGAASAAAVPGHVKAAEPVTAKDNGAVKGHGKGKSKALPRDIPRTSPAAVTAALDADLAADLSRVRLTSPHTSTSTLPQSPTRSPIKASRRLSALSTSPTKIPFPVRAPTGVHGPGADAVGIYASAVEAEQSGRLNDALRLYRTAFKLDDNVDRLYARQVARDVARAAEAVDEDELTVEDVVDPTAPPEAEYTFRRHIQVHPDHESGASRQSKLTALLSSAETADSTFMPADETLPVPLARLPAELVEPILAHLDVGAIEAFGGTCWRARALTAYAGVWRRIVRGIYRPPMLPPRLACAELARRHRGEWRTVLVEEERVRMDGCYIAVCHYVRPGAGEEWVAVTHMSESGRRASERGESEAAEPIRPESELTQSSSWTFPHPPLARRSHIPPLPPVLPRRHGHLLPDDRAPERRRPEPQPEPARQGAAFRAVAVDPER